MPKTIRPRIQDLLVRSCPFCGSFSILISNTHTACYSVRCDGGEAEVTGPCLEKSKWKTVARKVSDHLDAIRKAVSLWNTRSPEIDGELRPAQLSCTILHGEGKRFQDLGGNFG
jgi:hypothetical protein